MRHLEPASHSSYERLLDLVKYRGVAGPSSLAKALNESPQTVGNWARRGVSKEGALKAQEVYGINATYILEGKGMALAGRGDDADPRLPASDQAPLSLNAALELLAQAARRANPTARASAAGLLREVLIDPDSNADELIPIIAKRLSPRV